MNFVCVTQRYKSNYVRRQVQKRIEKFVNSRLKCAMLNMADAK